MSRQNLNELLGTASGAEVKAFGAAIQARRQADASAAKARRLANGLTARVRVSGALARKLIGGDLAPEQQEAALADALRQAIALALNPPKLQPREVSVDDLMRVALPSHRLIR